MTFCAKFFVESIFVSNVHRFGLLNWQRAEKLDAQWRDREAKGMNPGKEWMVDEPARNEIESHQNHDVPQ